MDGKMVVDGRGETRAKVRGSVVLHARHGVTRARVEDLSRGELRIRARSAPGDAFAAGTPVAVELRLDGVRGTWIQLIGHVVRAWRAGEPFEVALDVVPSSYDDVVQDALLADVEAFAHRRVLVIDPDPVRRARLVAAIIGLGCDVAEAATPLDVIHGLDESRAHVWLIVLAAERPSDGDLRAFLATEYPQVALLAITERGEIEPLGILGLDDGELTSSMARVLRRAD